MSERQIYLKDEYSKGYFIGQKDDKVYMGFLNYENEITMNPEEVEELVGQLRLSVNINRYPN